MTLVINDDWETGLASSLATGLRAVYQNVSCDGVLVMLADQPLIDAASLSQLLDAFNTDDRIIASEYDDTIGVPVVIGREHVPDLMALKGDAGAGAWLRKRIGRRHANPNGARSNGRRHAVRCRSAHARRRPTKACLSSDDEG